MGQENTFQPKVISKWKRKQGDEFRYAEKESVKFSKRRSGIFYKIVRRQ